MSTAGKGLETVTRRLKARSLFRYFCVFSIWIQSDWIYIHRETIAPGRA